MAAERNHNGTGHQIRYADTTITIHDVSNDGQPAQVEIARLYGPGAAHFGNANFGPVTEPTAVRKAVMDWINSPDPVTTDPAVRAR